MEVTIRKYGRSNAEEFKNKIHINQCHKERKF